MILHITLMLRKNRILESFNFTIYTHTHTHTHTHTLDAMPARCCGLVTCLCVVVGLWKKNIWRKTIAIHNIFKEKSTKLNSQPA